MVQDSGREEAVDRLSVSVLRAAFVTLCRVVGFGSLSLFAKDALQRARGSAEPP
jgi:hypothetical protein